MLANMLVKYLGLLDNLKEMLLFWESVAQEDKV